MATKELKPTLGTGIPKTRKRNIQTKLDPDTFRTAIFEILETHDLTSATVTALAAEELDYSRYGEVFCEVMIAGNIVEPGGAVRSSPPPTPLCVFAAEDEAGVDLVIDVMHQLMRRKPFLRARYDAVTAKILTCLAVFEEQPRANLATALGSMLSRQMLSPTVLKSLSSEAAIASGIALDFMTAVITTYIADDAGSIDKLMALLKSAGIDTGTMVDMMPSGSRSNDALSEHFSKLGLDKLVDQNERRIKADKIRYIRDNVAELIATTPTPPPEEVAAFVTLAKSQTGLADTEVVSATFSGVTHQVDLSRKAQQNRNALLTAIEQNAKMLKLVCSTGDHEIELIVSVQLFVSSDMELLKIAVFCDVLNLLYVNDVLSEDAILRWFRRGTSLQKGSAASSNIIREQMLPFIKWLETAEVESDEEETPAAAPMPVEA
jgi:eIF4-gamma/eIF5/eIF2-epsilon